MTDDGFREFVQVRHDELLRSAYLLCGTRQGAEDLVQSALLRAMPRWGRIDEPMAYLRKIMVNHRVNLWRRITSRELLGTVAPSPKRPRTTARPCCRFRCPRTSRCGRWTPAATWSPPRPSSSPTGNCACSASH